MMRGLISQDENHLATQGSDALFARGERSAAWRELPLDLREWVEPSTLFAWVEAEVLALDWKNPRVQEHLSRFPDFRPRTMLTLLAYGYVTQVFNSQEIVSRCRSDRALLAIGD